MLEMRYIEIYNAESLKFHDWFMVIETLKLPRLIPLSVAGVPAVFIPPGRKHGWICGSSPYVNPQTPDPCPHLAWGKMVTPKKLQMINVISVLTELINIQQVNFSQPLLLLNLFMEMNTCIQAHPCQLL